MRSGSCSPSAGQVTTCSDKVTWWRRGESKPLIGHSISLLSEKTCDSHLAPSGTSPASPSTTASHDGKSRSEVAAQKQDATPPGGKMGPDSCRSPACADQESAVSSPSGDAATSDDDEFRVLVAKLAAAWPLPDAIRSALLAMLDALRQEERAWFKNLRHRVTVAPTLGHSSELARLGGQPRPVAWQRPNGTTRCGLGPPGGGSARRPVPAECYPGLNHAGFFIAGLLPVGIVIGAVLGGFLGGVAGVVARHRRRKAGGNRPTAGA